MANERKGAVNWKGTPTDLAGPEIKKGDTMPANWTLVANDMTPFTPQAMQGKTTIVCALPSLDTPVCDTEMKRFNTEATAIPGVEVLAVSVDLPFAQKRWCGAAGAANVKAVSDYKDRTFGTAWGVLAPSKGLFARAVFVVGKDGKVRHAEYVKEVGSEPDYKLALDAARSDA